MKAPYIESLLSVSKVITGKTMIEHQKSKWQIFISMCTIRVTMIVLIMF